MMKAENGKEFSVESVFQAGKIFEKGGTYIDLLDVSSKIAKRDERINTLHLHEELTKPLMEYNAFMDIEFNPQKSINCQAEAAAVYVSLSRQGLLKEALKNKDSFREIVYSV